MSWNSRDEKDLWINMSLESPLRHLLKALPETDLQALDLQRDLLPILYQHVMRDLYNRTATLVVDYHEQTMFLSAIAISLIV